MGEKVSGSEVVYPGLSGVTLRSYTGSSGDTINYCLFGFFSPNKKIPIYSGVDNCIHKREEGEIPWYVTFVCSLTEKSCDMEKTGGCGVGSFTINVSESEEFPSLRRGGRVLPLGSRTCHRSHQTMGTVWGTGEREVRRLTSRTPRSFRVVLSTPTGLDQEQICIWVSY